MTGTISHLIYATLSLSLTIWVGRNLFRNGQLFIVSAFGGDKEMADAVNQLLLVGFYLVNLGFVALFLSSGYEPETVLELVEQVSTKLGIVSIVLGGMHYFNMFNFARIRRKSKKRDPDTPAAPSHNDEQMASKLAENPVV